MKKAKPDPIVKQVADILSKVRKEGDRALEFYARKFDGITLPAKRFEVPMRTMRAAADRIPSELKEAILTAKSRVERFHREEMKRIVPHWTASIDGIRVGQKASAIDSVGIYVPGGRFSYPSTVIMTSVPAKAAGVRNVIMVTPPGKAMDSVLAAAYLCDVDRCFTVGGPAAIAALAYGTRTIPAVDKIVGPGNRYVTEAKRQVFGDVGIDGIAGPSEVAVAADRTSDPKAVLLNLLAQAEHDPAARSFLVSSNNELLDRVRREIPKEFMPQVELIFEKSPERTAEIIDGIAPEHLVLAVKNPEKLLPLIKNAGAVFIGGGTPVPLGDYAAGPSHVLPTGRAARFSSGLSVKDFLKWSSIIQREGNASKAVQAARTLANTEGLRYHARSLE